MVRYAPRSRGKDIEPGPDFIQQMRDHIDDPVAEITFVPCPDTRTDFDHLTKEQLAYYSRWRYELHMGNLIQSD